MAVARTNWVLTWIPPMWPTSKSTQSALRSRRWTRKNSRKKSRPMIRWATGKLLEETRQAPPLRGLCLFAWHPGDVGNTELFRPGPGGFFHLLVTHTPDAADMGDVGIHRGPMPRLGVVHHFRAHHKGLRLAVKLVINGVDFCGTHVASLSCYRWIGECSKRFSQNDKSRIGPA